MDLILWRHAEAEEGKPDPASDLARKLTTRGHKHAKRMAQWLLQRLPSKYTVISSPARRALQTAEALGANPKVAPKLAPAASVQDVLEVAGWPRRKGVVILVGHQPSLGEVAAHLVAGAGSEWSIKKGGLWWLTRRERDKLEQIVVRAVTSPDLL